MPKPTDKEIEVKVIGDVATYARLKPSTVESNRTKALNKLGIDHAGFVHLAASLREYIKFFKPGATLKVSEVEKEKFTVDNLIDQVKGRIRT